MKKFLHLLLSIGLVFSLAACKNINTKNTNISSNIPTGNEILSNTDIFGDTFQSEISDLQISETNSTKTNTGDSVKTSDPTNTNNTTEQITSDTNTSTDFEKTDSDQSIHIHSYSEATCTEAKRCSCGATEGTALGHDWKDATCSAPKTCKNCGINEGSVIEHNFLNGKCSYCSKPGGTVEITLENWNQYFEIYEWVDWNKNAFDEPTEFFGIRISFRIKDEYVNNCTATVKCEYLINQSHCNVTYDVATETCTIGAPTDTFNEHSSTLEGGASESYISFSIGDMGQSGSYIMTKYNFVKMTRIQGTITFFG